MSYATGGKSGGGSYQKLNAHDEENPLANDPSRQLKKKAQIIETKLTQMQKNIKSLEDMSNQLGEKRVDGRQFRVKISNQIKQTKASSDSCAHEINQFGELKVNMDSKQDQADQLRAFQTKSRDMMARLGKVLNRTQERMNEFKDLATQSIVESSGAPSSQGNYMVNEEQKQTQYQLQPIDIKIQNETDLYEEIINDRQANIKDMADIMGNINSIAQDIALETANQGEKLQKLDENMNKADKNAEDALVELKQTVTYQRKNNRCTMVLVGIILCCLVVLGIVLGTQSS